MSDNELTDEDARNAVITTITLDISNKHLKEVPKTIKNFSNIEVGMQSLTLVSKKFCS